MLDDPIECAEGDELRGKMTLTRNPDLRRHLCVDIDCELYGANGGKKVHVAKRFPLWHPI